MLNDQSSCLAILVIAAILLWFIHSSRTVHHGGTQCSARKAEKKTDEKEDDDETDQGNLQGASARYATTVVDLNDDFGFVPLGEDGEEQFANMTTQPKTPNEIRKLESMLREEMSVDPNMGKFIGHTITGTLASCTGGTKEPSKKPDETSMFMLPAAFS